MGLIPGTESPMHFFQQDGYFSSNDRPNSSDQISHSFSPFLITSICFWNNLIRFSSPLFSNRKKFSTSLHRGRRILLALHLQFSHWPPYLGWISYQYHWLNMALPQAQNCTFVMHAGPAWSFKQSKGQRILSYSHNRVEIKALKGGFECWTSSNLPRPYNRKGKSCRWRYWILQSL